eukprot:3608245-Pyramimonas_sp.AAC.1
MAVALAAATAATSASASGVRSLPLRTTRAAADWRPSSTACTSSPLWSGIARWRWTALGRSGASSRALSAR